MSRQQVVALAPALAPGLVGYYGLEWWHKGLIALEYGML